MTIIQNASGKYFHTCASIIWIIWRHDSYAPVCGNDTVALPVAVTTIYSSNRNTASKHGFPWP